MLDNNAIESLSTGEVKKYFSLCDLVSPCISDNDKTPIWDGFLYLYNKSPKVKDNYDDRIPVQVKGHKVLEFSSDEVSHNVEVVDLRGYRKEGCLYFVVQVKEDGTAKIFSRMFSPLDIRTILKKTNPTQKTIAQSFKPLNENRQIVELDLSSFIKDCRKQQNCIDMEEFPVEKVMNGDEYKLTFSIHGTIKDLSTNLFDAKRTYLYAENKDGLTMPIGSGAFYVSISNIPNRIVEDVIVDGEVVANEYTKTISAKEITIEFSKGLILSFPKTTTPEKHQRNNISYDLTKLSLSERIDALKHYIKLICAKSIQFGQANIKVNTNPEHEYLSEIQNILSAYQRHKNVLDVLGLANQISYDNFTKEDNDTLNNLHRALILHEAIELKNPSPLLNVKVANLCLLLACKESGNGLYQIDNFFDCKDIQVFGGDETNSYITSPYSWLGVNGYIKFDNLKLSSQIDSYRHYCSKDERVYGQATLDLLQMLLAVDQLKDSEQFKRQELLNAAIAFSEWLKSENRGANNIEILSINNLQVIKRIREYTEDEKNELLTLSQFSENVEIKAAAYLLLDNYDSFLFLFSKLSKDVQDSFKQFPIYYFYAKKQ